MTREKIIKELKEKLKFSEKKVLEETACMPEWPYVQDKKVENKSEK